MTRHKLTKPDDAILKYMLKNGSANAYGVHKETGKTLSAVQAAFKRLESAGAIKFVKEVPTVKGGSPRRVFSLTLKGFGMAFLLTDGDFITSRGRPGFPNSKEEWQILRQFHRERLEVIIRHAGLHDIFNEIAIIFEGDEDLAQNFDGWLQIMHSVRGALGTISLEDPHCDFSNPFALQFGRAGYTEMPKIAFEYLFFKDLVSSWRPSEHNMFRQDATDLFMSALRIFRRSELLEAMFIDYMENERDMLKKGLDLFTDILGDKGD